MLQRYSPAQLIGFARRLDPGLRAQDFADAGRRLDRLPDQAFTAIGLSHDDISALRTRFTAWPRTAEAADRDPGQAAPARRSPGQWHISRGREAEQREPEAGQ